MAHAAFDDLDLVEVSDLEIRRPGPSTRSIPSMTSCEAESVDLIVGADLAGQLTTGTRRRSSATL